MPDEQELLEADRSAREHALDVTRSFVVQAPAGSGKTELLIQRYLKLLTKVDEPEEVLAITFTRKAAAEMQARVFDALRDARTRATADSPHKQITLDAAAAVLDRDAHRQWELARSMRRLRIQTLDAFCAGVARRMPLAAGLGGLPSAIVDDVEPVCRRAALATLDWLVADDESSAAVERVLRHLDNNTNAYVSYISRMLLARDQWLDITGSGAATNPERVRRRLESDLADLVRNELAGVRAMLDQLAPSQVYALAAQAAASLVDTGRTQHPAVACAGLDGLPEATVEALPAWRGFISLLLTKDGAWRTTINVESGFPADEQQRKRDWLNMINTVSNAPRLREALDEVRQLPEPIYSDRQWEVLLALLHVLPLAVTELRRLFAAENVCDHTEVALAAAAVLGDAEAPQEAALRLDYRIRHLLMDEMQDTSIAQYKMLATLTAGWEPGDGRTFFGVGDPMQSIYRFRNAEVGQFLRAQDSGLGSLPLERLTLRRNFRSGSNLVAWFNSVFEQAFPGADDVATGAVRYSPSLAVEALRDRGRVEVHPLFDANVEAEAGKTADVVQGVLEQTGDQSVAVLVRSRTQLPALLAEFRDRRIDYQAIEIDRLTDLPEIIDVLALTRALVHLADRAAWLALLRGPWVGLEWADLHTLAANSSGATVWTMLAEDSRTADLSEYARCALPMFVERIGPYLVTDGFAGLRERVERAWYALGGPGFIGESDDLANVYRFFDILERIEVAGTLADPAELLDILEAERVSSRGSEACRLQVMTMHKAKGLQFDHVILPSLGRFTSETRRSVLSWLNVPATDGGNDIVISPAGPAYEKGKDPLHDYVERSLKHRDKLEQDRLLYVACTRARESLYLIGSVSTTRNGSKVRPPRDDSLLGRMWAELEGEYADTFARRNEQEAPRTSRRSAMVVPRLQRGDLTWRLPDPPALPRRMDVATDDTDPTEVHFDWAGYAARQAGTIVHRWFHRFASSGVIPETEVSASMIEAQTRRWAMELGVAHDALADVCARVEDAVLGTLADPRGRWLLAGEGQAELSLTGAWEQGTATVVIDRVLIDSDGTHWVVDYKTSQHEGGDLEGFLAQEESRYAPTLARYARFYADFSGCEQVRTALYFPLLQQFREVRYSREAS